MFFRMLLVTYDALLAVPVMYRLTDTRILGKETLTGHKPTLGLRSCSITFRGVRKHLGSMTL